MDITTQQLRCFVAVAENLHFGRAAAALHLSPSTLSENVAALEKRVGRPLLRRSPRVALTAAGEELLPLAGRALSAMDDVHEWSTDARKQDTIRVGLMVSSRRFRTVMAGATDVMSQVSWEIKHLGFDGSYRALADDVVDCAFVTEAGPVPADVRAMPLWKEGCVVVMRDDHPLARRAGVRRADLSGETVIGGRTSDSSSRWLTTLLGDLGDVRVQSIAADFDEILELCGVGAGINIAGESAAGAYARPGLSFIPLLDLPDLVTHLCLSPNTSSAHVLEFARIVTDLARSVDD